MLNIDAVGCYKLLVNKLSNSQMSKLVAIGELRYYIMEFDF